MTCLKLSYTFNTGFIMEYFFHVVLVPKLKNLLSCCTVLQEFCNAIHIKDVYFHNLCLM